MQRFAARRRRTEKDWGVAGRVGIATPGKTRTVRVAESEADVQHGAQTSCPSPPLPRSRCRTAAIYMTTVTHMERGRPPSKPSTVFPSRIPNSFLPGPRKRPHASVGPPRRENSLGHLGISREERRAAVASILETRAPDRHVSPPSLMGPTRRETRPLCGSMIRVILSATPLDPGHGSRSGVLLRFL
jgi:hypothetical protein